MESKQKVNILLVDDQPAKLLSYEVILAELDENLITASSGSDALRHLLQTEIAVVLLDVCMPGLDGFELARMIREHPRMEKTAIILVSAVFMTDLDRLKGYHSGAVDYVPVPIIPEVLRAKVRVFADLYRKTEQLRAFNLELEQRVNERTSDLEESSESLRKSEERFRFLAETIPSMVWISAPDGTITYANRRLLEYHALAAEADNKWSEIKVHPADDKAWSVAWPENLTHGGRFEIEARHRRHDGAYRWFLTRAAPRKDPAGNLIGWFGVSTDIHDQMQMQQQLRDADRRKNEFLAVLSHELRNPLSPILNAVHLMRIHTATGPDLIWCRDVIERQAMYLTCLVDDLLDVSRITSGKVRLQKQQLDLATVINGAVETNRPLLESRNHVLEVEAPAEPLLVEGDPTRLAQVFGNLINNSSKYTEDGNRIQVRISSSPLPDGAGSEAVVHVIDNGLGISSVMLPFVFDLFTQGEHTIDQAQGGLGIGLSLVRSLIEMHGGIVEARSEGVGCGSEFIVRLPLLPAPILIPVTDPVPTLTNAKTPVERLILVVDDNRDSADSLAILLRTAGHLVHTANDGPTALAEAERLRPHVMLLDLGMPGMNGYETAYHLRQRPFGKQIVLIAQTGWGQEEDRRRTAEAGFDLHLTKPLDAAALMKILVDLPPPGLPVGARSTGSATPPEAKA